MTEKKEIKVKKSLLTLILKSIALSILTLFIIQHFGKITGSPNFGEITGSPTNGQYIRTLPSLRSRKFDSITSANSRSAPQPKHTLINVDEFWRKIKEAKVEEIPILAPGSLTGITYGNARSVLQPLKFENPISGEEYYKQYNHSYGIDRNRKETYLMKLKDFYLPSLFGNPIHILIGTILFAGFFEFFRNYKLKLS